MTQHEDAVRLRHMLEAAQDARRCAAGRSREDLDDDRALALALLKCIEIIGEAANHVSNETQAAHPAIPWVDIIGMRHRLVHVYFDIDLDLVWTTVERDVPELIALLDPLVGE